MIVGVGATTRADLPLLPSLAGLGAALSLWRRQRVRPPLRRLDIDPVVGAFGRTAATSALVVPLVLVFAPPWRSALSGATTWAALLGLALFSTVLAYVVFFRLLASGATNTSLVTLLLPVSAILLRSVFLDEELTAT